MATDTQTARLIPKHPGHPHPLKEQTTDEFNKCKKIKCNGCQQEDSSKRTWYRCVEGCPFILHACCAVNKPDTVTHHGYGENRFYLQHPAGSNNIKCDVCSKPVLGYVYHCPKKGTSLHPCCAHRKKRLVENEELLHCLCRIPNADEDRDPSISKISKNYLKPKKVVPAQGSNKRN